MPFSIHVAIGLHEFLNGLRVGIVVELAFHLILYLIEILVQIALVVLQTGILLFLISDIEYLMAKQQLGVFAGRLLQHTAFVEDTGIIERSEKRLAFHIGNQHGRHLTCIFCIGIGSGLFCRN